MLWLLREADTDDKDGLVCRTVIEAFQLLVTQLEAWDSGERRQWMTLMAGQIVKWLDDNVVIVGSSRMLFCPFDGV